MATSGPMMPGRSAADHESVVAFAKRDVRALLDQVERERAKWQALAQVAELMPDNPRLREVIVQGFADVAKAKTALIPVEAMIISQNSRTFERTLGTRRPGEEKADNRAGRREL